MSVRMETALAARNKIKRRTSYKPCAENLFGKRFSGLTIDDEYNYNLEYLISQNGSKKLQENSSSMTNHSGMDTKRYMPMNVQDSNFDYDPMRGTPIENYRSRLNHIKNRNFNETSELENILRSPKPTNNHSMLKENGAVSTPIVCHSPLVNKGQNLSNGAFSKNDGTIRIERFQPTRQAVIAAHQPADSVYPGLHIYVTESPPRPYYDVVSSFESLDPQATRKTVACDPIPSSLYSYMRARKTVSPTPQRDEDDSGKFRMERNSIRKSIEEIEQNSVATRVEAFMALLKHNESERPLENNYTVRPTPTIHENRITSPIENNIERPFVRFQRAATVNYGKSGDVAFPQMSEYCFTCCKRIYPVDRVSIGDRVYHKGCFRCNTCQRIVLPGNFASLDGIILCKPHYIEQFRLSGRYELRPHPVKAPNAGKSDSSCPVLDS